MLTVGKVKSAVSREKDYKLCDDRGLYLLVKKGGGKYWRFKYRIDGKEKLLSFGVFPDVVLPEARKKRDDARQMVRSGADPATNK